MNIQWNEHAAEFEVREWSPKVARSELLTACNITPAWEGDQLELK